MATLEERAKEILQKEQQPQKELSQAAQRLLALKKKESIERRAKKLLATPKKDCLRDRAQALLRKLKRKTCYYPACKRIYPPEPCLVYVEKPIADNIKISKTPDYVTLED